MHIVSTKIASKKNISLKVALSALLLGVSCQTGYAMEKAQTLGCEWMYGVPKMSEVIGMPSLRNSKSIQYNDNGITVAVIDTYVNPKVIALSKSCEIHAPLNYDFTENYHGTHVASTIKEISASVKFYNDLGPGQHITLEKAIRKVIYENKEVDVINLSLGYNKTEDLEAITQGGRTFLPMAAAAKAGKIMVKSLGNEYNTFSKEEHEFYCELLMQMAEHPEMRGRLLLVANADTSEYKDLLEISSNRPHRPCKYVITAPGTNITACVDVSKYKTISGTSMAAPIVSGIIGQLLFDFREERKFYMENDLGNDGGLDYKFKDIIVEGVLLNARKTSLINGRTLGGEFGQGIVNYDDAKKSIDQQIHATFEKKAINYGAPNQNPINQDRSSLLTLKEELDAGMASVELANAQLEARLKAARQEKETRIAAEARDAEIASIKFLIIELGIQKENPENQYETLKKNGGFSDDNLFFALYG